MKNQQTLFWSSFFVIWSAYALCGLILDASGRLGTPGAPHIIPLMQITQLVSAPLSMAGLAIMINIALKKIFVARVYRVLYWLLLVPPVAIFIVGALRPPYDIGLRHSHFAFILTSGIALFLYILEQFICLILGAIGKMANRKLETQ